MKVLSICAGVLTVAFSFCALTSRAAAPTVKVSELKGFESGNPIEINGTLNMDEDFDLGTSTLILKGVSSVTRGKVFTGSKGSVLDIEFTNTSEYSFTGSGVFLDGDLKFIKRGPGKVRLPAASPHAGGTMVCDGIVDGVTGNTRALSENCSPFGAKGSTLEIVGGTVLIHAYNNMADYYPVVLNGGCLKNDATFGSGKNFNASLEVNADSTIEAEKALPFLPSSISGTGKLSFVGEAGFTIGKDLSIPTVSLSVAAPFALNGHDLEVNDYEVRGGGLVSGEGTVTVNGTFKPTAGTIGSTLLKSGAKIDLSGKAEAWDGDSVDFAENARVTIMLGNRELTSNQRIVSWTKKPSGVSFDFTGDNIGDKEFTVSDSGIVYDAKSDAVASATWTGAGDAGNWMDPANWSCKNAAGNEIANPDLTTDLTVTFTGDVSSVSFDKSFPFAGVYFNGATLTKETDWTEFDLNLLTDDSVLDVKGYALKVSAGTGESTTEATITSFAEGAELTFVVDEGETYTNSTLNLSGELKLVKDGAGTFVAKKCPQTYTGKTVVGGGVLRCGIEQVGECGAFGAANRIELLAGGVLDPFGSYDWSKVTLDLNGGSVSNTLEATGIATVKGDPVAFKLTGNSSNVGRKFDPQVNLGADALIATDADFNFQGKVHASEYLLELRVPSEKYLLWNPTQATNLHVKVSGGGSLAVWSKAPVAYDCQPGIRLETADAALALVTYAISTGTWAGSMEVFDYIANVPGKANFGQATLSVRGTFTPVGNYFYGCTLQDGATIDLSGKAGAWDIVSEETNTVKFAEDATIAIVVGPRSVEAGNVLVTWPEGTEYGGRKFVLEGNDVEGLALSWSDDGIKVISTDTKTAKARWTNADGDGDFGNTNNWYCTNARGTQLPNVLPDQDTAVEIPVAFLANLNCAEKTFDCASLIFTSDHPEAPLELAGDCDWRGLGEMDFSFPVDLKGHDLTLTLGDVVETNSQTIVNSAETAARLFLVVPEDKTYLNGGLALSDNLALVKLGEGVYVAAKENQTYVGGTIVSNGVLRCMSEADIADSQPFGTQKTIDVAEGGALDPAGSYNWSDYTLNMRGGAIRNTIAQVGKSGSSTAYTITKFDRPFDPQLNLFASTDFDSTESFNFAGTISGEGHRLTVRVGKADNTMSWTATTVGAVEAEFALGKLKTYVNLPPTTPEMSLIMNGATFDFGCDALNVRDYIAKTTDYDAVRTKDDWRNENGVMNVSGVFAPVSQKFFGCTMLDGSAICLADRSEVWSTMAQSSRGNGRLFVDFAEGAKVTIDVHGRTFKGDVQIVQWEEGSTNNLDTVKFRLDDASRAAGYSLSFKPYVDDTDKGGLWIGRKGLMLLIR